MATRKGSLTVRGDSFIVGFYYNNERFRATIPALSASKKAHHKTAENILTRIQGDIASGVFNLHDHFPNHPRANKFRDGSGITISESLLTWLDRRYRDCEASTHKDYKSAINSHLIPAFGELRLSELTTSDIHNWKDDLLISNKRINNVLIPLRAIFSEAYQDELIDKNPLDRIKHLPLRQAEPEPFTREELESILNACEGQVRNIFEFAFWTGLRTSELIALQWEDINLENGFAFIRHVRTRTGEKDRPKTTSSIRQLELLPPALHALKEQVQYTENEGHIFLNPDTEQPWKHDGPLRKTAWIPALKKASVKYRKPYSTRHTFASMVLSAGADPMWVASQMGHKDWGMIRKVYGRWLPDVNTSNQNKISSLWAQDSHKGDTSD